MEMINNNQTVTADTAKGALENYNQALLTEDYKTLTDLIESNSYFITKDDLNQINTLKSTLFNALVDKPSTLELLKQKARFIRVAEKQFHNTECIKTAFLERSKIHPGEFKLIQEYLHPSTNFGYIDDNKFSQHFLDQISSSDALIREFTFNNKLHYITGAPCKQDLKNPDLINISIFSALSNQEAPRYHNEISIDINCDKNQKFKIVNSHNYEFENPELYLVAIEFVEKTLFREFSLDSKLETVLSPFLANKIQDSYCPSPASIVDKFVLFQNQNNEKYPAFISIMQRLIDKLTITPEHSWQTALRTNDLEQTYDLITSNLHMVTPIELNCFKQDHKLLIDAIELQNKQASACFRNGDNQNYLLFSKAENQSIKMAEQYKNIILAATTVKQDLYKDLYLEPKIHTSPETVMFNLPTPIDQKIENAEYSHQKDFSSLANAVYDPQGVNDTWYELSELRNYQFASAIDNSNFWKMNQILSRDWIETTKWIPNQLNIERIESILFSENDPYSGKSYIDHDLFRFKIIENLIKDNKLSNDIAQNNLPTSTNLTNNKNIIKDDVAF